MKIENNKTFLTYGDVLIKPRYSEILPQDTDLSTKFSRNIFLKIPLVSAAMDSVTEHNMAITMANHGGLGVIHKNLSIEKQANEVKKVKDAGKLQVAATIGVGEGELERAAALINAGVDVLVVDTAHGHSKNVLDMVKAFKRRFNVDLVAGNVGTKEACLDLIRLGVDGVKVGIGPGAICTTRVVAGVGIPQFSAIVDCFKICSKYRIPFIADGGIKYSGDIVKALAAGSSAVMIGSLLAGTDEAPGELFSDQGKSFKSYRGMGSLAAMELGSKDRYMQAGVSNQKLVPEGVEGKVPYKGPASDVIHQLLGGIRSGMGYIGAKNFEELRKESVFIRVSNHAVTEGHPHGVHITKKAPNY